MNTLTADGFYAVRKSNGDVWISHSALNQPTIIITKEDCAELAKLLMWPYVMAGVSEPVKVDYSRCVEEPE